MSRTTRPLSQRLGLSRIKLQLRQQSIAKIQQRYQMVAQGLEDGSLSWWEWAVLTGQLRELSAAQHLVETLFATAAEEPTSDERVLETDPFPSGRSLALSRPIAAALDRHTFTENDDFQTLKYVILDRLTAKLTLPLTNQTDTPLEIDILKPVKKQELFLVVLKQFEALLDELRFSRVSRSQLKSKRRQLLQDLWQSSATDFLGKYRTIAVGTLDASTSATEIMQQVLLDIVVVDNAILERVPLFVELLDHLLFHSDLEMDRQVYPVGSSEAILQGEAILGNVVLQISNAVAQPLINRFSGVDELRRDFFDRRWLSTREIERFRNALSWKYRVLQWFVEPTDIFESQYRLLAFSEAGLQYRTIYAPRDLELKTLSGVPFVVTLALETRDAVAPPLQAAVTIVGRGIVFVLTQVIGRSIGLVGRGVLQGIGYVRGEVRSRSAPSANQRQP
ncbi:DUF3685 domain-containing protein [Altericista sp. CCNU0014]|uniref:DUF3685 domain-containing protein n=1 Tax=Altericista sp. CCNU0014 TaxID=3082949 RepID=UPI003850CCC5